MKVTNTSDSVIDVFMHHGFVHFTLQPGEEKVIDLVEIPVRNNDGSLAYEDAKKTKLKTKKVLPEKFGQEFPITAKSTREDGRLLVWE